jgi:hypothetical protein
MDDNDLRATQTCLVHGQRMLTMPDDLKPVIDQLANSLQTVTLLATQLRQDLADSAKRAAELEAAADQAVGARSSDWQPGNNDR